MNLKLSRVILFGVSALAALTTNAIAYSIKYNSGKTQATVYCDNGDLAGTLYWNGSAWSNGKGLKGPDVDDLAQKLVKSSGKACK